MRAAGWPTLQIQTAVVEALPGGRLACRVEAVARPRPTADIGVEIWLPEPTDWSGRYYQMGNGGFAGRIHRPTLAAAAGRGDVAAATDTGHKGDGFDASWARGRPDLVADYAYRSIKATADAAAHLIRIYYRRPARHRYFMGCSFGGRQALVAAARWPRDWDGVIAGAPAYDWLGALMGFARIARAVPSGDAVLRRTLIGEGYLPDEIDARDWSTWITASDPAGPSQRRLAIEAHRHMFGAGPTRTPDKGAPVRRRTAAGLRRLFQLGDLRRYLSSGGKILVYFGRADPVLPPARAIEHRRLLAAQLGAEVLGRSYRLFLVPGMGHCQGGSAPHALGQSIGAPAGSDKPDSDVRRAIERWVERDGAPDLLIAHDASATADRSRHLRPVVD